MVVVVGPIGFRLEPLPSARIVRVVGVVNVLTHVGFSDG